MVDPSGFTSNWQRNDQFGTLMPIGEEEPIPLLLAIVQLSERFAIDSKLRACDLMALTVGDVAQAGRVQPRSLIVQQKTGRPVEFEITEQTQFSIQDWIGTAQLS